MQSIIRKGPQVFREKIGSLLGRYGLGLMEVRVCWFRFLDMFRV